MADPFSIAGGCIALATTAIKLAETLFEYTKSVREAEKLLKPVAEHVQLTSTVLKSIGTLLDGAEIQQVYTDALLQSTKSALAGCRRAFTNLEDYVRLKFSKGRDGSLSVSTKFMFSFRQKELDVLQAHLERFKSSLDLILGVLNLAVAVKTAKDTAALVDMKLDVQKLMVAEWKAQQRDSQLALESQRNQSVAVRSIDAPAQHHSEESVGQYLDDCAKAATELAFTVNKSLDQWQKDQTYDPAGISRVYDSTRVALHNLSRRGCLLGFEADALLHYRTGPPRPASLLWPDDGIRDSRASLPGSAVPQALIVLFFILATIATGGLFLFGYWFYRHRKRTKEHAMMSCHEEYGATPTKGQYVAEFKPAGPRPVRSRYAYKPRPTASNGGQMGRDEIAPVPNHVYELDGGTPEPATESPEFVVDDLLRRWTRLHVE